MASLRSFALSGLVLAAAQGWTTAARGALPCPIRVSPAGESDWKAASERLAADARFDAHADCSAIEITVLPAGGARLEFVTRDGRSAARRLERPDELPALLEALLVTVAPPPPTPSGSAAAAPAVQTPSPSTPPTAKSTPVDAGSVTRLESRQHAALLLGVAAVGRLTMAHKYLAPGAALRATGVFERWEVGIFGEWDPLHVHLSGSLPGGASLSVLDVGAIVGRRERAGRLAISYGVSLGVAAVASSAPADATSSSERSVDGAQQRVGAYVGSRYPRDRSTHFTTELWFDAALSGLRRAATIADNVPGFPRYGLALSLGVETVAM